MSDKKEPPLLKETPSHTRCRIYGCDEPHAPGIIWCEKHKEPFVHREEM